MFRGETALPTRSDKGWRGGVVGAWRLSLVGSLPLHLPDVPIMHP
jgi:hypothetical protein